MKQIQFGAWTVEVDREATRTGQLGQFPNGVCGCSSCSNFYLASSRKQVFTEEVTDSLEALGIDPMSPVEVYELGPSDGRGYLYGGWFNAVGRIVDGVEQFAQMAPDTEVCLKKEGLLAAPWFPSAPLFRVEFRCVVPWVLLRPPPED
jgi:hypothetical protein